MAQLISKSCFLANKPIPLRGDKYNKLLDKYQPQIMRLRSMGLVFDERVALQLLDKYNGDISTVASILLGL